MNETTEKKKGKFNFFDALLILLVLALLAGGAYLLLRKKRATGTSEQKGLTVRYTVRYHLIPDALNVRIENGDTMYFTTDKSQAGKVVSVREEPSVFTDFSTETNSYVTALYPNCTEYYVTVEATAQKNADSYMVNGTNLSVGKKLYMRTASFSSEADICELQEVVEK